MAKKIGANIALNGEKEFRQAISGINSDMKVLGSEMKKVTAEFLDNNGSVEALSAKDEVLNKQLDKQKEKVEALKAALENSQKQYGENDTRTDKWKISLNNAEAEMSKLTKEVKDNKEAMEQAKNPTEKLGNEFKKTGDNAENAGKKAISMGDIIKANVISSAIISGVQSLANKFSSLASGALESADSIQQMADQTGMSAEDIQKWQYAGDTLGVSIEKITGSQSKLIKSMDNVRNGSDKYVAAFKTLGVETMNSDGSLRDSSEVMTEVFNALGKVKNESDRNALAMQVFGKSAKDLNPLISAGSGELKKLSEQAEKTGAVMSNDTVSSLDDFGDTMDQVKTSLTGIAGSILGQFAPSLTNLANKVKENAPAIQATVKGIADKVGEFVGFFVNHGTEVISVIGGIAAGFVAWNVVTMIQGVVGAIKAFQLANEGATIAQYALNLAMNLNPVGIIITAIAALVAGVIVLWNTNKDFRDAVTGIFNSIKEGFMKAWDTIKTFVTETIPGVFNKFIGWIKDNWKGLLLLLVNPFAGAFKLIYDNCDTFRNTINGFVDKVKTLVTKLFNGMVNGIKDLPKNFSNTASSAGKALWNGINDLKDWIVEKVTGFGKTVVKGVSTGITGMADIGLNLVKGIWNGISDATSWILEKIKGFGKSVLNGIKSIFGIHSPSTVFRDEVGKYLAQGIGVGFTDEMTKISSDMSRSIPTNFDISGSYSMTPTMSNATPANNSPIPADIGNIGFNITIQQNNEGVFKVVRTEATKYFNMTHKSPFPITL